MHSENENYIRFKEKTEEVSAFVNEFKTIKEAQESTIDICVKNNSGRKKNILQ